MKKPGFAGLALLITSQSAYAADDYAAGVKAYSNGDFGTSIRLLSSAIKGTHSKNGIAHYYLGNAYLQLKNNSAALFEYRESLRVAPQAECAQHCLTAINHLTGVSVPPKQANVVQAVPISVTKPIANANTNIPAKILGLPPIPTFTKDDGPVLADVLNWSQPQQVLYQLPAYDRKNEALSRLERTQETLKRAQAIATSAVGSSRRFGETDDVMQSRIANERVQMAEILKPFNAAVEARQKEVEQMNQIYEVCLSAGRR